MSNSKKTKLHECGSNALSSVFAQLPQNDTQCENAYVESVETGANTIFAQHVLQQQFLGETQPTVAPPIAIVAVRAAVTLMINA